MNTCTLTPPRRSARDRHQADVGARYLVARVRPDLDTPDTDWRVLRLRLDEPTHLRVMHLITTCPKLWEWRGPYLTERRALEAAIDLANAHQQPRKTARVLPVPRQDRPATPA